MQDILEPSLLQTISGELLHTIMLLIVLQDKYAAYAWFRTKNSPPIMTDVDTAIAVINRMVVVVWFIVL